MYDDQGHIPVKLLAGRDSSALTIGAGVAFAILGHGGAPHIAGRNLADPEPLVHTVRLIAGGSLIGVTTSCATKAVASSDISFPCNEGETILDAAERAGYALPYSCRKGVCASCEGKLASGSVAVGRGATTCGPAVHVKFCIARPTGIVEIALVRIERDVPPARKTFNAVVHRIERPKDDVAILHLRLPTGRRAPFRAGQYARDCCCRMVPAATIRWRIRRIRTRRSNCMSARFRDVSSRSGPSPAWRSAKPFRSNCLMVASPSTKAVRRSSCSRPVLDSHPSRRWSKTALLQKS